VAGDRFEKPGERGARVSLRRTVGGERLLEGVRDDGGGRAGLRGGAPENSHRAANADDFKISRPPERVVVQPERPRVGGARKADLPSSKRGLVTRVQGGGAISSFDGLRKIPRHPLARTPDGAFYAFPQHRRSSSAARYKGQADLRVRCTCSRGFPAPRTSAFARPGPRGEGRSGPRGNLRFLVRDLARHDSKKGLKRLADFARCAELSPGSKAGSGGDSKRVFAPTTRAGRWLHGKTECRNPASMPVAAERAGAVSSRGATVPSIDRQRPNLHRAGRARDVGTTRSA